MGDLFGFNGNKEYCLSKLSVFNISLGGSSFNLFLMSIERLINIAYPVAQSHWLTKNKACRCINIRLGLRIC